LFKKGGRIISLLTSFSEVFEKRLYTQDYQHINQNNILVNELYGFRSNSSTLQAPYKLINDILLELINKVTVGGIFCDLENAFDGVNRDILLLKLEFVGIVSKAYNTLIESYLNDRYQKVLRDHRHYSSTSSDWAKVKHNVIQDLIPGPLFFLPYINDLPKIITGISQQVLFADKTSIHISKPSPTEFINDFNKLLVNISDWFKINLVSFNFDKTYFVQFRTKSNH
jgi:hypothetical protein